MVTPTFDPSLFTAPTWEIKVNSVTRPDVMLSSVELGYGTDISNATFTIHKDPSESGFPQHEDLVEVIVNGASLLKGKIKGITDRISSQGLTKVFTVLSNITTFQNNVVSIDKDHFNFDKNENGELIDEQNAPEILQSILGFIPIGTPNEFPGEIHITDQTLLGAADSIIRKLGNYKIFYNQETDLIEFYRFGQGGEVTRLFVKGENIIDSSLTDNRQNVVNKLTLVGAPKAKRIEEVIGYSLNLPLRDDGTGVSRRSFTLEKSNVRDIRVLGSKRAAANIVYDKDIEVIPEDFIGAGNAEWPTPTIIAGGYVEEYSGGDSGFKRAVKEIGLTLPVLDDITVRPVYRSRNEVDVFLTEMPLLRDNILFSGLVSNRNIGILPLDGETLVRVKLGVSVFFGSIKVRYTFDEDRPTVIVGSGTVERTITDNQYQIFVDTVVGEEFDNEDEVLAAMQERAQAEFEKLNRPSISGTITIVGDETVGLKSTVLVNGIKLDVVKVVHNFTSGFTTQIALTNEPFIAALAVAAPRVERRQNAERVSSTEFRVTLLEDVEIDQNIAALRKQELQNRLQLASTAHAVYQD